MTLFDLPPGDEPEYQGPDARRTTRQQRDIAAGRHPLGDPLLEPLGPTCGDCIYSHKRAGGGKGSVWKCHHHVTHGAATDLRRSWPACVRFAARSDAVPCPNERCQDGIVRFNETERAELRAATPKYLPIDTGRRCEVCAGIGLIPKPPAEGANDG